MRLLPEHPDDPVKQTARVRDCLRIEMRLHAAGRRPRNPHRIDIEGNKIQRVVSERVLGVTAGAYTGFLREATSLLVQFCRCPTNTGLPEIDLV